MQPTRDDRQHSPKQPNQKVTNLLHEKLFEMAFTWEDSLFCTILLMAQESYLHEQGATNNNNPLQDNLSVSFGRSNDLEQFSIHITTPISRRYRCF